MKLLSTAVQGSNAQYKDFFCTSGPLAVESESYIVRRADQELLEMVRKGEFCYVLTARQKGKTSLLERASSRLKAEGFRCGTARATGIASNPTTKDFYRGLLKELGTDLQMTSLCEQSWRANAQLHPCQRFFSVITDHVLPLCGKGLVIFVDEIDSVPALHTDEFFAAIHATYSRRANDRRLASLRFVILGTALQGDLIKNPKVTPFNIGRQIELADFTKEELVGKDGVDSAFLLVMMGALVEVDGDDRRIIALEILEQIFHWTNGHPYLTQKLCEAVAATIAKGPQRSYSSSVDFVCKSLFLSTKAQDSEPNLKWVRTFLAPGLIRDLRFQLRAVAAELQQRSTRDASVVQKLGKFLMSRGGPYPNTDYERAFNHLLTEAPNSAAASALSEAASEQARWETLHVPALELYRKLFTFWGKWRKRIRFQPQDKHAQFLLLSGVVRVTSGDFLRCHNRIYREVFDKHWLDKVLDDLARRLKRARFQGGVKALAVGLGIFIVPWLIYTNSKTNRALRTSNAQISALNTEVTKTNAALSDSNRALTILNSQLNSRNDELIASNSWISTSNQTLIVLNNWLGTANGNLSTTNASLVSSNTLLVSANQTLIGSNIWFRTVNDKLTSSNATLVDANNLLFSANQTLTFSNAWFRMVNDKLSSSNGTLVISNALLLSAAQGLGNSNAWFRAINGQLSSSNADLLASNLWLNARYVEVSDSNAVLRTANGWLNLFDFQRSANWQNDPPEQ